MRWSHALAVAGVSLGLLGMARADTIAYWHLDGNGEDSVGSHDLAFAEATSTTRTDPEAGDALVDPVPATSHTNPNSTLFGNNYALAQDNPNTSHDSTFDFDPAKSFTVEGWFHITATAASWIVGNRTASAATRYPTTQNWRGWSVNVQGSGGTLNFYIGGSAASSDDQSLTATIAPGQTHYFAAVWDAAAGVSGEMRLYVDAAPAGTLAGDPDWSSNRGGPLSIGGRDAGTGYNSWMAAGEIDEIRYSNEALAPSEFLNAVPEPGTLSLMVLSGVILMRRKR